MPKAMMSGRSFAQPEPCTPITCSTASMPTSCSAMYGIVAMMPVSATATMSDPEPKRPRTKSAGVT